MRSECVVAFWVKSSHYPLGFDNFHWAEKKPHIVRGAFKKKYPVGLLNLFTIPGSLHLLLKAFLLLFETLKNAVPWPTL